MPFTLARRYLLIAALLFVSSRPAAAADVTIKPGDQVVRIDIQTPEQLQQLLNLDLDLWSDHVGIGFVPAHVSLSEREALKQAGLAYEVVNPDLMGTYEREQRELASRERQPYDAYPTLEQLNSYITSLAITYPSLCEVFSIGTSIEGRALRVLHITGPGAGHKPAVFYHGLIHAREWISAPVVLYLADHLVNNYGTDPDVTALVNELDIYLAPCVNPDGYAYSWTPNNRLWRKNRRDNGNGTFGVDLNRNWALGWGGGGSSGTPGDLTYRGTAPFSEPETIVLSDFIRTHPNIIAYMDYHSFSQLILWPYGYAAIVPPEPDYTTFDTLGSQMQSLIQAVHGVYYEQGPIYSTIYQASGGSVDWVYGDQSRYAFTIELRPSSGDPDGFILPPTQILPTCEENLPAILRLTEWAAQQSRLSISLPSGIPAVLEAGLATTVDVQISYFGQSLLPDSALLHYRYDEGAYQTVPLAPVFGDLYRATLPPAACGDTPQFYFSVQGSESGTITEPAGGESAPYTVGVGQIITLFSDDCETDPGWTVQNSTSPLLTDGAWDRGVPVDCNRGDPPTDYDGSGQCWLTDNSAASSCNSDVDGGYTWLISPTLDLSDPDATVSYALWYTNDGGGAPSSDYFKVYVSNDDGANWILVSTFGPVSAAGWNVHAFDVADFVTPTSMVKLRFEASDLGSGSLVEAGVDAISVTRISCQTPSCPTVLGDVSHDTLIDGADVQGFVNAMLGVYDPCADMDSSGGPIDAGDLSLFVTALVGS